MQPTRPNTTRRPRGTVPYPRSETHRAAPNGPARNDTQRRDTAALGKLAVSSCLVGMCAIAVACEPKPAATPGPVFGGEVTATDARPLPANMNESILNGPCSPAAPASETLLIDDFEDGDNRPFKEFQREGYWYSAGDTTPGEMSPKPNTFAAEPLPDSESTPQNRMAAHLSASGYSDWGVVWGTSLRWVDAGVKCPFNGSKFAGVRFRARGTGRVRVNVGIPETIPKEYDGVCVERCYDTHSRVVLLTPDWETYEVPWVELQQWGWGTQARFDATRILSLQFAVDGKNLPVDFWLDDVAFIAASNTAPGVGPSAGQ